MTYVFLDTETTGLDTGLADVWEIAYAVDDGPILSSFVAHSTVGADPAALEISGYHERFRGEPFLGLRFEAELRKALEGATLVAANPAFDAGFLSCRWGGAPWKYRLFDLQAYAMPALGHDEPQGLAKIADALGVAAPDHTAAADVHTLRECFRALRTHYLRTGG